MLKQNLMLQNIIKVYFLTPTLDRLKTLVPWDGSSSLKKEMSGVLFIIEPSNVI